ncbi:hypothetical protein PI93_019435 [Pandoraea fibrosis]|uniref:Oxygen-regulated invasion protein OrgB n=1 Tax=Pandoraea fibrosis TaxID=1891094 RepID=A0ABX6HUL4_9BURK|nr:hypothetical protein [Pandoraea fibrosis]QHE91858.1 hypothetical protein PJ20_008565 [Pandoraea fibrosis]QHF14585.1 hypothetical protein PI93_019435 [Pandoraea fibrosis]
MLRIIEDPFPSSFADAEEEGRPSSFSPLVKQAEIDRARNAADLLSQAERQAAELIACAERDAARIRANAFREGVAEGISAALAPIATLALQWQSVHQTLREKIAGHLHDCIEDLFENDQVLGAILDAVLAQHLPHQPERIRICVPSVAAIRELESRCEALGISAVVTLGEEEGVFSVAWSGHVWKAHFADIKALVWDESQRNVEAPEVSEVRDACRAALLDVAEGFSASR